MPLRMALVLPLLLAAACGHGGEPPSLSPAPPSPIDAAAVPGFTLDSCGPASAAAGGRGLCDPVNLVFPGTSVVRVTTALLAAGWSLVGVGSPEFVTDPGTSQVLAPSAQLFETQPDGASSQRFHVRLWQLVNGDTVGAVHHEAGAVEHQIDRDWEDGEAEVERVLCPAAASCAHEAAIPEQQARQDGSDRWRGFRNDARPAVIRLA